MSRYNVGSLTLTQSLYNDTAMVRVSFADETLASVATKEASSLAHMLGELYDCCRGKVKALTDQGFFVFRTGCDTLILYKRKHKRLRAVGFCKPQAILLVRSLLLEPLNTTRRISGTLSRHTGEFLATQYLAQQVATAAAQDTLYRLFRRYIVEYILVAETLNHWTTGELNQ